MPITTAWCRGHTTFWPSTLPGQLLPRAWDACCRAVVLPLLCTLTLDACGGSEGGVGQTGDPTLDGVNAQAARALVPAMGLGVNFAETEGFRRCVTVPLQNEPVFFENALYHEQAITSQTDLDKAFGLSAEVSAKGFWGSAGASTSLFNDISIHDNAFLWLVHARFMLSDESIDSGHTDFALTDSAKAILADLGIDAFYRACGSHFYSSRKKGAHYALLYHFESRESKTIDKIKSSANFGGWGIQAKAEFQNFLAAAERAKMLRIHAWRSGGDADLASYAVNPERLEQELLKLRQGLLAGGQGLSEQWAITSYNIFQEVLVAQSRESQESEARRQFPTMLAEQLREDFLKESYQKFRSNSDESHRLTSLLARCSGPDPLCLLTDPKRDHIEDHVRNLQADNAIIARASRQCMFAEDIEDKCSGAQAQVSAALRSQPLAPNDIAVDMDLTGLGDWDLLIDYDGTRRTVGLYGRPPNSIRMFSFQMPFRFRVYADESVQTFPESDHFPGSIEIGKLNTVLDPETGRDRPNFCVYNHQDVCTLRLIKQQGEDPRSSVPNVKLSLTLLDQWGFPVETTLYPLSSSSR